MRYTIFMNEQLDRVELKLAEIERKLDSIVASAAITRRNSRIVLWFTIAAIVGPLIIFSLFPNLIGGFLQSQGVGQLQGLGF
jgi:hypothetical protein